jgi:hypothetical protein
MRVFAKWAAAAIVGTAMGGIGAAAAADIPVPYNQPRYSQPQQPPAEYYPPEQEEYVEAPPAYVYPAPPPPVYRYYYGPPVVRVLPPRVYGYPYYPRYYSYRGPRPYVSFRGHRPYVGAHIARGPYGPRGYRHW